MYNDYFYNKLLCVPIIFPMDDGASDKIRTYTVTILSRLPPAFGLR